MKKLFPILTDYINSDSHPIRERVFVLLNHVMVLSFAIMILINSVTGATVRDTLISLAILAVSIYIAGFARRKNRVNAGAIAISAILIFALLPCIFFSAGGIYGGAPILFVFPALYISMILARKYRGIFYTAQMAVAVICYLLSFHYPELVRQNTAAVAFVDSYAALFFLSLAIGVMVTFEILLYQKQSQRAEKQRQEIEALNAAQNRFFSSMSHEIRTPINTIIGLNEMILRENVSEEVAEDAANIQAASRMLLHLINDILDMSKLESGCMELTPTVYSVGDMLSELVGMFWGRAKEKGLEFRVSVAPDVPAELVGDEVRIKQILINVLNNALKYTNEGSVTLSLQCGTRKGSDLNMIYSISDTGIGIKKESIPFLFTAFKRVDEEKNRHIEGTGLGLSIVKQLVDLMGGTITVNSIYAQGSSFIIELPQQASGEETVGVIDLEKRQKTARENYRSRFKAPDASVLVVDDNSSNLLVISKLLRDTEVQVDTASSGEIALSKTLENAYHVILMDHLMPGMDGLECRRRILEQAGGRCREAKIIALTANADSDSRALYEREGFDGYLTKPIDAVTLERELARYLPSELVHSLDDEEDITEESMAWIRTSQRKRLVAVATESVADLPRDMLEQYRIASLPHLVVTDCGVFRDVVDIESNSLLSYLYNPENKVRTMAPDSAALEAFFAEQLKYTHHLVFIVLSSRVENSAYPAAVEAAAAFDNVTVIDSGHLSGGQGLMVLEACRMAEQGKTPAEITRQMEALKSLVHTSFIVDNLDYLSRAGQVSGTVARITKALTVHPVLALKNGKMGVEGVYLGSRKRVWKKYIKDALRTPTAIDPQMLFITYAGVSRKDLEWILQEVNNSGVRFEKICFQKASAAISVNCGPDCFGLLFRKKSA